MCVCMLSHSAAFDSFVTQWTVSCQAPLSMESPGKNTGVGCHFLLQEIFPTLGSYPCLPQWQADSFPLSHLGSPTHKVIN